MQQFARVVSEGAVVPVIVDQDQLLDLRRLVPDITPDIIASGVLADVDRAPLEPVDGAVTYLAPVHGIRQVSATGFNYRKHIAEFNMTPPSEPEVFLKAVSSLCGPTDPISRGPNPGTKLDWETELAIVVSREARDISVDEAADYIFGYVCLNDVSDRATQVDGQGQQHLVRAKSRPTYCPIGPYLTTGVDGMELEVWTKLNGQFEQRGNTSDMLFGIYEILAYFSAHMTLWPGDLLATGTPPGVGFGKNVFMSPGDILECGITHLGAQRHQIHP